MVATGWLHYWWNFLEVAVGKRIPATSNRFLNTITKVAIDQMIVSTENIFIIFIGCSSVFVGLTMRQTFFSPGCSHLHLHILCHYAWRQGIRGTAQSKRQSTQTRRSCTVQGHLRTSSRDAATDHVATLDTVASRAHLEFLLQSTASSGLGAKSRTRGMVRVSIAPQQWRTVDDARRGD